jgi:hypothetical protein
MEENDYRSRKVRKHGGRREKGKIMIERARLNGFRIRKEGSVQERIGRELEKSGKVKERSVIGLERTGKFSTDQV